MGPQRIGVWLDSYGRAFKDALRAAAADGFGLVQAAALHGTLSPAELSGTGRRHLVRHLADLGLHIDGLGLEFPDLGPAAPDFAERRLAMVRDVVTLAHDLGAARVAVRSGGFAPDSPAELIREVLSALAELSDRSGVMIAVQPADAAIRQAAEKVGSVGCETLSVALDTLDTPDVSELENEVFAGRIGWATLRDVRRRGSAVEQTAYGAGDVDFQRLLSILEQKGYSGPLTLRTDAGGSAALNQGRVFLESILSLSA